MHPPREADRLSNEAGVLATAGVHPHLPWVKVPPQLLRTLLATVRLPKGAAVPDAFRCFVEEGWSGMVMGPYCAFGDMLDVFSALKPVRRGACWLLWPIIIVLAQIFAALRHLKIHRLYHGDLKLEQLLVRAIYLVRESCLPRCSRYNAETGGMSVEGEPLPAPPPGAQGAERYAHVLRRIEADATAQADANIVRVARGEAPLPIDPLVAVPIIVVADYDNGGTKDVTVGTPHTTAPEVWVRDRFDPFLPINSEAVDVFAAGVCGFTLGANFFPFGHTAANAPGLSKEERGALVGDAILARELSRPIPHALDPLMPFLDTLLAYSPAGRPSIDNALNWCLVTLGQPPVLPIAPAPALAAAGGGCW